jgi:hypothetical protein
MKRMNNISLLINIYTVIFWFLCMGISLAQSNKYFKGDYKINDSISGKAEYFYQIINDTTVFNGKFQFKSDLHRIGGNGNFAQYSLSGTFKENKKVDRWQFEIGEYSVNYKSIQDLKLNTSLDGVERKIISRYNNGVPEGEWEIFRNSIIDGRRQGQAISSKALFNNGIITGRFSFEDRDESRYVSVTGNFDNNGYFHSVWSLKYNYDGVDYEEFRNYENGFLKQIQVRDLDRKELIYDVNFEDVISKISQIQNKDPDINFVEGDISFGLLFDNGYHPSDEKIKAQLIGNELLENVFTRYNKKASVIGLIKGSKSPVINFTKRFKFVYPEEEASILKELLPKVREEIQSFDTLLTNNKFILNKQKTDSLAFAFSFLEHTIEKLNLIDSAIVKLQDGTFNYTNRNNFYKKGIPALKQIDTIKYTFESKPKVSVVDYGIKINNPDRLVHKLNDFYHAIDSISMSVLSYTLTQIQYISEEKELEIIDSEIVSLSREIDSLYRFKIKFDDIKQKDLNLKSNGRSEPDKIIPEMYILMGMEKKEAWIEKYSKESEFLKKEEIGKELIGFLKTLIEIYPDLQLITIMKPTLDSAYTRFSPNPFMDRLAESRIKPHIYSKGMERLLPSLLEDLKKSSNSEELKKKTNEILKFRKRMLELAIIDDDEIEKLNVRMRRENVPERIKRLLGLVSTNNQ